MNIQKLEKKNIQGINGAFLQHFHHLKTIKLSTLNSYFQFSQHFRQFKGWMIKTYVILFL